MKRVVIAPPSVSKSEVRGYSRGILIEEGKRILFTAGQLAKKRLREEFSGILKTP